MSFPSFVSVLIFHFFLPFIPQSGNDEANLPVELVVSVRNQVEYYFSKENLQTDAYLLSMMDANKSVPIPVIMGFAKMKSLTQDESVVERALESSNVVSVIDGRIRAILKSGGRTTLILRDIQSDASEEEVREIFNFEGCKPILSLRSDIGNTWFVAVENEDDAKATLDDLKLKKRTQYYLVI